MTFCAAYKAITDAIVNVGGTILKPLNFLGDAVEAVFRIGENLHVTVRQSEAGKNNIRVKNTDSGAEWEGDAELISDLAVVDANGEAGPLFMKGGNPEPPCRLKITLKTKTGNGGCNIPFRVVGEDDAEEIEVVDEDEEEAEE